MMKWIKKIFGLARPEQITMEQIEQLPPAKLCRKFIDGELESDTECEMFDSIMCAVELHGEVFNGGFNQYYYNSGGDRSERARSTFALLGADRIADVVKRANECYAAHEDNLETQWEDRTKESLRNSYKEKLFDTLDEEYYALMKNDKQLYGMIGTYIKQHPQEFLTRRKKCDNICDGQSNSLEEPDGILEYKREFTFWERIQDWFYRIFLSVLALMFLFVIIKKVWLWIAG